MKKIIVITAVLFSFFAAPSANAQVRVNVNIGGGVYQQPAYYDDCDYYYIPEIDAYYNVTRRLYVFNDGGRWISAAYLPNRWRGYSWNRGVRIYGRTPYMRNDEYRRRYADWGRGNNGYNGGGRGGNGYYGGHRGGYNQGGYNNGNNNGGWNNGGHGGSNNGGWNNGNHNGGGNGNNGGWNNGNHSGGNGNNGGGNNGNQNGGGNNGGQHGGGNWHDHR